MSAESERQRYLDQPGPPPDVYLPPWKRSGRDITVEKVIAAPYDSGPLGGMSLARCTVCERFVDAADRQALERHVAEHRHQLGEYKPSDAPKKDAPPAAQIDNAKAQATKIGNQLSGLRTRMKKALASGDAAKAAELEGRAAELEAERTHLRKAVK